jgi:C4-type Zn-finger protein
MIYCINCGFRICQVIEANRRQPIPYKQDLVEYRTFPRALSY